MYELEPNNNVASANPISLGESYSGQLSSSQDIDSYGFEITTRRQVATFNFEVPERNYTNFWVTVVDNASSSVDDAAMYFRATSSSIEINVGLENVGSYTLAVTDKPGDFLYPDMQYTVSFVGLADNTSGVGPVAHEMENSNVEGILSSSWWVEGQIGGEDDVDYHAVLVDREGVIEVEFDAPELNYANYNVSIVGSDAGIVANRQTSTDTILGTSVSLDGGQYFVAISDYGGDFLTPDAPYRLRLTSDSDFGDPYSSPLIATSTAQDEEIDSSAEGPSTTNDDVETNSLSVIADLFGSYVFLSDLTERVTGSSRVIEYNGSNFDYSEIDGFVITVIRNGEFTSEFASEIEESFPAHAGISYGTAVALIGQANIESTLLMVAGADGNYVG